MDLKISGKTALITGASRGIGRATCIELANNGVNIVAVARNENDLNSLNEQIVSGVSFTPIALDLAIPSNLEKLFLQIHERNIEISIIVNNLGGQLEVTDPLGQYNDFEKVFYLNLGVAVGINHHFVPRMVKNKWGRICHVSSIAALENQGPPQYCAAKSALVLMSFASQWTIPASRRNSFCNTATAEEAAITAKFNRSIIASSFNQRQKSFRDFQVLLGFNHMPRQRRHWIEGNFSGVSRASTVIHGLQK
jgi:NAD(P)-dependent dehydrogenase (short-subunit alcohol dehydrogenase family)